MAPHHLQTQRDIRTQNLLKSNGTTRKFLGINAPISPNAQISQNVQISPRTKSPFILSPALQGSDKSPLMNSNGLEAIFNKSYSKPRKKESRLNILDLPADLHQEIALDAKLQNRYLLREWMNDKKLNFSKLATNPNCVTYLNELFILYITDKQKYDDKPHDEKIDWSTLSYNPNAMYLISQKIALEYKTASNLLNYPDKIDWSALSSNPNAIMFLEQRIEEEEALSEQDLEKRHFSDKIFWGSLSRNPNAIHLLKANPLKIVWPFFVTNTNLDIDLFKPLLLKIKNKAELTRNEDIIFNLLWNIPNSKLIKELYKIFPDVIDWDMLSFNKCTEAIKLLTANQDKINWDNLSTNTNSKAIELLRQFPADINLYNLCLNTNQKAIHLIEDIIGRHPEYLRNDPMTRNQTKVSIGWGRLSANPKAIKLLEKYPQHIVLSGICSNPNAVRLIKPRIKDITEPNELYNLSSNPCIFYEK